MSPDLTARETKIGEPPTVNETVRRAADASQAGHESSRMWEVSFELLATVRFDGYMQQVNPRWQETLGWTPDELLSKPFTDLVHPDDLARTMAETAKVGRGGHKTISFENRYRCRDGTYRWLRWNSMGSLDDSLIYAAAHDITERVEHLAALEAEARRRTTQQEAIIELGERALREKNLDSLMAAVADRVASALGVKIARVLELSDDGDAFLTRAEVGLRGTQGTVPVGSRASSHARFTLRQRQAVLVDDHGDEARFDRTPAFEDAGVLSSLSVAIPGNPRPFGVLEAASPATRAFNADDARFLRAVATLVADAIERTHSEDAVRKLALHDDLTGLPNRTLFFDRLSFGLARAKRTGGLLAVLFLDVDGFKAYNESLGHLGADQLLAEVAARIGRGVRATDTVARFGGDEFIVLCEDLTGQHQLECLADRLLGAFEAPVSVDGGLHDLTLSIGLALDPETGDGEELVRDADRAMYRSKQQGGGRWTVCTEGMRASAVHVVAAGD